jgi:geranylgeranyl pyrophosphate synthase
MTNLVYQNDIKLIEAALKRFLPSITSTPTVLHQAMHYVVMNGGKRIRALLVYATGRLLGATQQDMDRAACAVEFIHAYSLTHDDLPAMDNDDLRRGKPTCHLAFDEATAILVGDALQCLAFDILVEEYDTALPACTRLKMLSSLTTACSSLGMAGGQALDLLATGQKITLDELADIHRRKTGALIKASIQMGALSSNHLNEEHHLHLNHFAENIGLAFQIQDDIIDVLSPTELLGKQQGKDQLLEKATYPSLIGMERAQQERDLALDKALFSLNQLTFNTEQLSHLANYIVQRVN